MPQTQGWGPLLAVPGGAAVVCWDTESEAVVVLVVAGTELGVDIVMVRINVVLDVLVTPFVVIVSTSGGTKRAKVSHLPNST